MPESQVPRNCHIISVKRDNKRHATNYIWLDGESDTLYVDDGTKMSDSILLFMACGLGLAEREVRGRVEKKPYRKPLTILDVGHDLD